ncbi:SAM-dependent methyltransferase [Paenibacillus sp. SI8]|uniref:SAM-dependent methyltransferase n=1 Tax=unclassified Paenibacillus TaxID=185978 RepID=UPI003465BE96
MEMVEETKVFSESLIWSLQRDYFKENGIEAWKNSEVPHYITNNPFLAKSYAEIVFHFFMDIERMNGKVNEKIYLIELGGGTGRLAYHFLTYFQELCQSVSASIPEFCYILSDLPSKNIDFWNCHPQLKPFVEQGNLDFSVFDVEKDTSIHLIHSNKTISIQSLSQPLLVVANYFFDSIPHDLFYFDNGTVFECLVHLTSNSNTENPSPAEQLKSAHLNYQYKIIENSPYEERFFNDLLENYKTHIKKSHVLIPSVGIRCLERLRQFSNEGILLLSADKGYHCISELDEQTEPALVYHGSFSLTVNYHAFKLYGEDQGGQTFFTPHSHQHLNLIGLLIVPGAGLYTNTKAAYDRFISGFGPDDFFSLKKYFEKHFHEMKQGQLLSFIRLSGYDAHLFKQCIPHFRKILSEISSQDKQGMFVMIQRVWEMYYPIGEDQDLAFDMGTMLYQMDLYEEAIVFFMRSLEGFGQAAPTYYNLAICYYMLANEKALDYLEICLQLDPSHMEAATLRTSIASKGGV